MGQGSGVCCRFGATTFFLVEGSRCLRLKFTKDGLDLLHGSERRANHLCGPHPADDSTAGRTIGRRARSLIRIFKYFCSSVCDLNSYWEMMSSKREDIIVYGLPPR